MKHTTHIEKESKHLLQQYALGFVSSLTLTLIAFYVAANQVPYAVWIIAGTAILQIVVQLVCFLHLTSRSSDRSTGLTLLLAFTLIAILLGGTLWIMQNLEHLHMEMPGIEELYEGGDVSPEHELH